MLRLLLIISIFINISYAQGQRYFIQLGSFKDQRLLERNIAKLPHELRSHIVVVKSNYWLIPFAYHTPNKVALYRKLSEYKRYFPDAIVSSSTYILSHKVVLNYVEQKSPSRATPQPREPKIAYYKAPQYKPKMYQNEQYVSPEATVVYHPEAKLYQPKRYSSLEPTVIYHPEATRYQEETYSPPEPTVVYHPEVQSYQEEVYQDEDTASIVQREEESITDAPLVASTKEPLSVIESAPIVSYQATPTPLKTVSIPKPSAITDTRSIKRYHNFSSQMLSGQQYYIAYKATESNPNLLIKVKFGTHTVSYQAIIGDMKMADAHYIVDNHRLYMYADSFSEDGAYSKIEGQRPDHILVSSWAGGKKLNTLRYYFRLSDAKRYLSVVQSNDKLSETIEEGLDYDWGLDL